VLGCARGLRLFMRPNAGTQTPEVFYDQRHARGWMDYWAQDKIDRVLNLIVSALPSAKATVLEYGCGTGVFTAALKAARPDLEVHGCDISPLGIQKARAGHSDIRFHLLTEAGAEPELPEPDVVYTHHVLEHVQDLEGTIAHIAHLVRPGGRVLHILPCGNSGSLEHNIATLIANGVASDGTGLFSLDDISHVRRLTSSDLEGVAARHGLVLERAFYANQFWGDIEYLSAQLYWGLLGWLNPRKARSAVAAGQLLALLLVFLSLSVIRIMPPYILKTFRYKRRLWKAVAFWLLVVPSAVLYPISAAINRSLIVAREWEWRHHKERRNGGEMYLLFTRPFLHVQT
jgi:SAM-dependent methyltransferase